MKTFILAFAIFVAGFVAKFSLATESQTTNNKTEISKPVSSVQKECPLVNPH
jgi:hypothetical protein